MSGSSPSTVVSPPLIRHDVFLNFRGEETLDSFSHLNAELCRKKVDIYIDYRLGRGVEISPALHKEIEDSKIYVRISKHHTSSTWYLDELTRILECKKIYGRDVIPVFSRWIHQLLGNKEKYAEALNEHEELFKEKCKHGRLL